MQGLSSLDGKLVIDISNCNSVLSITQTNGKQQATFEVSRNND